MDRLGGAADHQLPATLPNAVIGVSFRFHRFASRTTMQVRSACRGGLHPFAAKRVEVLDIAFITVTTSLCLDDMFQMCTQTSRLYPHLHFSTPNPLLVDGAAENSGAGQSALLFPLQDPYYLNVGAPWCRPRMPGHYC